MTARFIRANRWLDHHPKAVVGAAVAVMVALLLAITANAVATNRQGDRINKLAEAGQNAHDALCVFRADLSRRVVQTEAFIASHPGGFGGVSVDDLRNTLHNQRLTLDALSILRCK